MSRHFIGEEIEKANKHMKRYLNLLEIRELQFGIIAIILHLLDRQILKSWLLPSVGKMGCVHLAPCCGRDQSSHSREGSDTPPWH